MVGKYQKRISGLVLDRIDIHLDIPRVPMHKLAGLDSGEASTSIRQRVESARAIQEARFAAVNKANVWCMGIWGQPRCKSSASWTKMARYDPHGGRAHGPECEGLSSRAQVRAHDCRPGGERGGNAAHLAEAL